MATLVLFANAVGVMLFLRGRTDRLLSAVIDPLHPDWQGMQQAFAGFAVYAVSLLAVAAIAVLFFVRGIVRKAGAARELPRRPAVPMVALAVVVTTVIVLVFIEVLLFQDYGVHLYEFDVFGILADAALRRDLGIQPAEVARVTVAALGLLAAELALCMAAFRLARWKEGALARASATALLVAIPGGFALFRSGEHAIESDRAEFEGALPLGKQLLFRATSRPFIGVRPRLDAASGYPVIPATDSAPALSWKSNIVFFVADGLRADMSTAALTPNLRAFGGRPDVLSPRRTFSTGHVSEAGIFGLLYGLNGQAFHSFVEARIPPYPLQLLKRNGYHTLLLASSRLSPYPSDQLMKVFDEVAYPRNDDEAIAALTAYLEARRLDGRPYFVLGFFYTPHFPFTSAKPPFRKYPLVGPKARTNYMNDVLQADDYFRQVHELVRADFEKGRTILLATSDHGEEIRDHGAFGHASATFWNEKIEVPFALGLPGSKLGTSRTPALVSHVDVWPTIFDHLGLNPRVDAPRYSDGRSLLQSPVSTPQALVTGRFFPYADRPSVLIEGANKYWFRVGRLGANNRLCVVVTRVTDIDDRPVSADPAAMDARIIPAFDRLQQGFWRFIAPDESSVRGDRPLC